MNHYYRKTDSFYSGFQKLDLFSDREFRLVAGIFAISTLLIIPVCFHSENNIRECGYLARSLFFTGPAAMIIAGGATPAAWLWYAAFAVFTCAATIPFQFGASSNWTAFAIPAIVSLFMLSRSAKSVFVSLGYKDDEHPLKITAFTTITGIMFVIVSYYVITVARGSNMKMLQPVDYVVYTLSNIAVYGPFLGLMYGILSRRLLSLRFELAMPITLNTLLLFMTWVPASNKSSEPAVYLFGSAASCLLTQVTLGLAFYFCRSTRMVFLAYLIYYLFYKSISL